LPFAAFMPELTNPPKVISLSSNSGYYYVHFLEEVAEELRQKEFVVQTGLDTVSKAEQLAYAVLFNNGFFQEEEPRTCYRGIETQ
jgi:hypothetical protein